MYRKIIQQLITKIFGKEISGKKKIAGVFTLGQATKEQKEEIEQKQHQLQSIKNDGL